MPGSALVGRTGGPRRLRLLFGARRQQHSRRIVDAGKGRKTVAGRIAEHGLSATCNRGLVADDGTINWWCPPRFDSPSVFGSLLDTGKGGHFRIGPETEGCVVRQLYFPDTAILITRFMTLDGVGEVINFMPVEEPHLASDRHHLARVVRVVRVVRGDALRPRVRRGSTIGVRATTWR